MSLGLGLASSRTSLHFSRSAGLSSSCATLSLSLWLVSAAEIQIRELTWNKNNPTERKTKEKGGEVLFFLLFDLQ